jgi:hypothetical protein
MTLKMKKRLLTALSLLIFSAAGGILIWGFCQAPGAEPAGAGESSLASNAKRLLKTSRSSSVTTDKSSTSPAVGLQSFAALWERPLRRPLFDPPPRPQVVAEKKALPPLRARLLATMIEAENSMALLRLSNGEVVFRKVGQPLGAEEPTAKIARIEAGSVSVTREGNETRLLVDGQKSK